MRLAALLAFACRSAQYLCVMAAQSSEVRDLPPLKMGATDLDAILLKTHSLIDAANGPDELGREAVKIEY